MRKLLLLNLLVAFNLVLAHGQSGYDERMMDMEWDLNSDKTIYGNKVTRLEGTNDEFDITNVGFSSYQQLIAGANKDAADEMWTKEKKDQRIRMHNVLSPGGVIHLFIGRVTVGEANLKHFTVIIQDENLKELFRKGLIANVPSPPEGDNIWYSIGRVDMLKTLPKSFYVYVIDEVGVHGKKYKFKITY